MAKKSSVEKNKRREKLAKAFAGRRERLKTIANDQSLPMEDRFTARLKLAKRFGFMVIHDFAYADLGFEGYRPPSILQVGGAKDLAVEIFSMSKSYNMAGWRIGYMVGNKDLVYALSRIKGYHDYGTFTPVQVAAIAALEGDQRCVKDIAATYQRRRDVLVKGMNDAGWPVEPLQPDAPATLVQ